MLQTAGVPPNQGRINRPMIGWTWNNRNALRNIVTGKRTRFTVNRLYHRACALHALWSYTVENPGLIVEKSMRLALAIGITCAVAAAGETVTFHKDVLPVLQARCQECHRAGEIGPMSLMSYAEARPWAKSIKAAVVSTK